MVKNALGRGMIKDIIACVDSALQPIVDMQSGTIIGYEALVRNFEKLGFKTPPQLFDHAREYGILLDLETALRKKAIEKFAATPLAQSKKLFINLEHTLFGRTNQLISVTSEQLSRHNLSPSNVCFEMPENIESGLQGEIECAMNSLRAQGYGLAIDDFGSGFAQMRWLHECEPDYIKIDRFFISSISTDSKKRLLVASIVELAHILGIRVVAEGVETLEELLACKRIGCDLVQGFLLGRPATDLETICTFDVKPTFAAIQDADEISAQERHLEHETQDLFALTDTAEMADVIDVFRQKAQNLIPILNSLEEPIGLVRERDLVSYLYMPFGRDLLANKTNKNRLRNFIVSCPVRDIKTPLDLIIDTVSDDLTDGLILVDKGKYAGFLPSNALLRLSNEMRIRAAEDKNPLTKLPGNMSIMRYVQKLSSEETRTRHFCYIDFDNFKPFNDSYGFQLGDRALKMFADIIQKRLTLENIFQGHIGGDDFFIGFEGYGTARVQQLMMEIREKFSAAAANLYSLEHRTQGFSVGKDRNGNEQRFLLLTCSIAIIELSKDVKSDAIGLQIAHAKKAAKASKNGIYVHAPSETEKLEAKAKAS